MHEYKEGTACSNDHPVIVGTMCIMSYPGMERFILTDYSQSPIIKAQS